MNHKIFIYAGIISILYGLFLKNELNHNWVEAKSIVTHVDVKGNVLKTLNGLNIDEIESHASVVYKIDDEIKKAKISVIRSQPVQVGNVIPVEYNENDRKRIKKKIPSYYWFLKFGVIMFFISFVIYRVESD